MKIFKDNSGVYTEEASAVLEDGMSIDQISFLTTQTVNSLALDVLIGLNHKSEVGK
jgi:hypothetical protein